MLESSISTALATQLATFHMLELPIKREKRWLFDLIETYISKSRTLIFAKPADKERYDRFAAFQLDAEYEQLK